MSKTDGLATNAGKKIKVHNLQTLIDSSMMQTTKPDRD